MTQLESARRGIITEEMKCAAKADNVSPEFIRKGIEKGTIVLPFNQRHKGLQAVAVGEGLHTKINANIGTSSDYSNITDEIKKLESALEAGADAVMDLSTGGDIPAIRKQILEKCNVPLGTVPIYEAAIGAIEKHGSIVKMESEELFEVIERQCAEGVDFITVHCGLTQGAIDKLKAQGRITSIVSRGGAFLAGWMAFNKRENPLYEQYDRLLEIAKKYDVTLSLGDGLRSGCLADATDRAQIEELIILGELVKRARDAGVQAMVEGPGHMPINQIEMNIKLQKSLCNGAPFYVLGPLVTDIAAGYDHITSAIGGAVAGMAGADFLCYVTPAEHLGLPGAEDVRMGVIASKIAAHAADISKGFTDSIERDNKMAHAREELDWEAQIKLALDPIRASQMRDAHKTSGDACSMCGDFCAIEFIKEYLKDKD